MFSNNVGTIDRILRIIVGVLLLAAFFLMPSTSSLHYFYLIGIVPILTAVIGSCPLYSLFGLSTCPVRKP